MEDGPRTSTVPLTNPDSLVNITVLIYVDVTHPLCMSEDRNPPFSLFCDAPYKGIASSWNDKVNLSL